MNIFQLEDISKERLLNNNGQGIGVIINNETFYVLVNIKNESNKLIALSGGALDQSKRKPPVYMRSKWKDDINQNTIFIDDKTIHGKELTIGWGIGTKERHFLKDYHLIVKKISEVLEIQDENVMYYGSSMGGLMSIIMASMHKDSIAVVDNPQTHVYKYYSGFVDKMCSVIFADLNKDEILEKYPERLSTIEAMIHNKYNPRIYYYQNDKSPFDMNYHVSPFKKAYKANNLDSNQISYHFYSDSVKGHNPLSKEKTLKIFDEIFGK